MWWRKWKKSFRGTASTYCGCKSINFWEKILFVDESTSALDKENSKIIEEKLLSNEDLTLVLISHHLSEEQKSDLME